MIVSLRHLQERTFCRLYWDLSAVPQDVLPAETFGRIVPKGLFVLEYFGEQLGVKTCARNVLFSQHQGAEGAARSTAGHAGARASARGVLGQCMGGTGGPSRLTVMIKPPSRSLLQVGFAHLESRWSQFDLGWAFGDHRRAHRWAGAKGRPHAKGTGSGAAVGPPGQQG